MGLPIREVGGREAETRHRGGQRRCQPCGDLDRRGPHRPGADASRFLQACPVDDRGLGGDGRLGLLCRGAGGIRRISRRRPSGRLAGRGGVEGQPDPGRRQPGIPRHPPAIPARPQVSRPRLECSTRPSRRTRYGVPGRPFRELAAGEAEGWRPSLVFSPMLLEDGRRLLISNLDLAHYSRGLPGHCWVWTGSTNVPRRTGCIRCQPSNSTDSSPRRSVSRSAPRCV